eukprot:365412-Chlamydomonas_euryale.AAC.25
MPDGTCRSGGSSGASRSMQMRRMMCAMARFAIGGRPDNICIMVHANAQTSAFAVTSPEGSICSGDMYPNVPQICVCGAPHVASMTRLMPKSVSTTDPEWVSRTLSGFRSSITTPASCSSHSARAMSRDRNTASLVLSLPPGCFATCADKLVG